MNVRLRERSHVTTTHTDNIRLGGAERGVIKESARQKRCRRRSRSMGETQRHSEVHDLEAKCAYEPVCGGGGVVAA
eukprot:3555899-Pleurochrysis_carterae.AAC.1